MATHSLPYVTPEQYLEFDRNSEGNNEYIHGEIRPVEGGTPAHATIAANSIFAIMKRLAPGGCRVMASSLRISVDRKSMYVYPDTSVICGKLDYTDDRKDTVTNPTMIIEVLSPSTVNYDLGLKTRMYWKIPSLTDLLFIDQGKVWLEYWFRSPGGKWDSRELESLNDILQIESLAIEIPATEIYAGVEDLVFE
jgi:Uma2 family endonuclease